MVILVLLFRRKCKKCYDNRWKRVVVQPTSTVEPTVPEEQPMTAPTSKVSITLSQLEEMTRTHVAQLREPNTATEVN